MAVTTVDEAEPSAPSASPAGSARLGGYHPGLDGLRGVAMLFMLAYHSQLPHTDGAFLGLSQFFTLSGFLITTVLLRSHQRGGIDLKRFWVRRFQRLMPAALLCLAFVALFGATVASREQAADLPLQVFAAATYWANWLFIVTDQSYVNLFAAPSPVQHYWSLAVEEQFYLLMPIAMFLFLRRSRSWRVMAAVLGGGALLSTAWMIFLYESGAGLDRIYYGTDTRMAEILVGALLAVAVVEFGDRFTERTFGVLGFIGVVAYLISAWGSVTIPLADGPIWRGGMLVYSFISCAVILGILSRRGPLNPVLSWGPFPSMGRVTYGVYLYHWPIFLWLTAERTGLDPWPLFGLRLAVTFTVAALSYNLVESPIRRNGLRSLDIRLRLLAAPVAVVVLVGATFVATNRPIADPLATIRSTDSSLSPPIDPGDGVLDILVIADDTDPAVVARLDELGRQDDTLSVTLADPFSCSELVEVANGRTCSNWVTSWPQLVSEHDPDLVLLYVTNWPTSDITRLAGPDADPAAVLDEVLSAGFDLLSSKGAPILWAVPGARLSRQVALSLAPFSVTMSGLEQRRDDLRHVLGTRLPDPEQHSPEDYVELAAAALLADASLYQRVDLDESTRVLILGDSQARSLGFGLERWAAATGKAVVWNAATEGCGLADDGRVMTMHGAEALSDKCLGAAEAWTRQVDSFRPDIVIALTSVWDLVDREFPGSTEFLEPGQPAFDAYLTEEFVGAVDTWTSHGATVIWMTAPCSRYQPFPGQNAATAPEFSEERSTHLNDEILPEVIEQRPETRRFELDEVLCPGGEFRNEIDGVSPVRIDGIHFSVEGSMWFAETYGDELLSMENR